MNVNKYLSRINSSTLTNVSLDNLRKLQRNHLKAIPWENLDLISGKYISLSLEEIYDKVINNKRGGYCFELNFLFGWLLNELGYEYYYISINIFITSFQRYLKHKLHLGLIVILNKKHYFLDVGSVRLMNEPIEVVVNKPQIQDFAVFQFRIEDSTNSFVLEMCSRKDFSDDKIEWIPQYKFQLDALKLEYVKELNDLAQKREYSAVLYKTGLSRHTDNSLCLLFGFKYSEKVFNGNEAEQKTEKIINQAEANELIRRKFGIFVDEIIDLKDEPIPNHL